MLQEFSFFPAILWAAPKGNLTVALSSDISSLDTQNHNIRVNYIVGWHLYDNLVYRDQKTLKIGPHLAESWKLIDDNTWEFKLRKEDQVRQRGAFYRRVREVHHRAGPGPQMPPAAVCLLDKGSEDHR